MYITRANKKGPSTKPFHVLYIILPIFVLYSWLTGLKGEGTGKHSVENDTECLGKRRRIEGYQRNIWLLL